MDTCFMFTLRVSACQHAALDSAEAGAQAIIEHLIADSNDQTADQRWVDTIAQFQPLAIARAQVADDLGALLFAQFDRANYFASERAGVALAILFERLNHRW